MAGSRGGGGPLSKQPLTGAGALSAMSRRGWSRLSPGARAHIVVAAIGFAAGALFGDLVFGVVEDAVGEYLDDILFGIAGAALASLLYDVAMLLRRRRP